MRKVLSFMAMAIVCAGVLSLSASTRADDSAKETVKKGTIKVTVEGEDGKPVQDANVTITVRQARRQQQQPQQQNAAPGDNGNAGNGNAGNGDNNKGNQTGRRRNPPVAKGMTDAKGVCTLTDVPVGDYNLSARKADVGTARKRVKIKEGDNDEVTLTLKKTAPRRQQNQNQQ